MYLFGGIDGTRNYLNNLHVFHTDKHLWDKITAASEFTPTGRSVFSMFSNSKGIWIGGGLSHNGKLSDMWMYSHESNTWQEIR